MPESADTDITLTWNGQTWTVSPSPGLRFKRGATISVPIPAEVLEPEVRRQRAGDSERKLLFPAGTVLYFPIEPVRDQLAFNQIAAARKPNLRRTTNGDQLPIIIEEDLYIRTGSESLAPCRCSYAGPDSRQFKSLNDAATNAKTRWTDSVAGTVGVFQAVSFVHDERLIRIDFQRQHVLRGTPLPDNPQPNLGPTLPFGNQATIQPKANPQGDHRDPTEAQRAKRDSTQPQSVSEKLTAYRQLIDNEPDPERKRYLKRGLNAIHLSGALALANDDSDQPAHRVAPIPARQPDADPYELAIARQGRGDAPDEFDYINDDDDQSSVTPPSLQANASGLLQEKAPSTGSCTAAESKAIAYLSLITTAVEKTTGVPVNRALQPSDKIADLNLDSLDMMEIVLHIEVALNATTPPGAETTWVTVEDVLNTYNALHRPPSVSASCHHSVDTN